MDSNAPLERLIQAVMALDALPERAGQSVEVRCLWRKLEWVATEAETALRRVEQAPVEPAAVSERREKHSA